MNDDDMARVVAQFQEVCERLSIVSVTAMRANADAQHTHSQYSEAARGTNHPRIRQAIADIQIAGDKSAKITRLLAEARTHFGKYLNHIAPGSLPDDGDVDLATPSGEQLVKEAENRADAKPSWAGFVRKAARDAENLKDTATTVGEVGEQGFKILRNPSGPSGAQATEASTVSNTASSSSRQKIEVPDAFGNLVIVGVIVVVAAEKADRLIRKGFARLRKR